MRDFFDICSQFFAKVSDRIGVADFQREEGVGGVFN